MDFIWECIAIAIKGTLGVVFICVIVILVFSIIGGISHFIAKKKHNTKPKYKERPIIINGGRRGKSAK